MNLVNYKRAILSFKIYKLKIKNLSMNIYKPTMFFIVSQNIYTIETTKEFTKLIYKEKVLIWQYNLFIHYIDI